VRFFDDVNKADKSEAIAVVSKFGALYWCYTSPFGPKGTSGRYNSHVPVICSTISILAVTPLSLQALEFERTRLIRRYLSFAYSEMAEAIYFLDSGLKKRAS
jgi:hypothetical protein